MADFQQIDRARKLLNLGEEATLEQMKESYRKLALKYHPDRCKDEQRQRCEEKFKKINQSKDILMNYFANYRFSFKQRDVTSNTMDKQVYEHLKRFYDGWWGDLDL